MGFVPVITAEHPLLHEQSPEEIRAAYTSLFPGMRIEVNLIENMLEMGHQLVTMTAEGQLPTPEVFVTTKCFAILNRSPESLMCHFSRCIQKIDGAFALLSVPGDL